jgi:hypothetical protein
MDLSLKNQGVVCICMAGYENTRSLCIYAHGGTSAQAQATPLLIIFANHLPPAGQKPTARHAQAGNRGFFKSHLARGGHGCRVGGRRAETETNGVVGVLKRNIIHRSDATCRDRRVRQGLDESRHIAFATLGLRLLGLPSYLSTYDAAELPVFGGGHWVLFRERLGLMVQDVGIHSISGPAIGSCSGCVWGLFFVM